MPDTAPHTNVTGAPLAGRSVVVTRAREQAAKLAGPLETLGARVIAVPVIEITDPPDAARFDAAVARVGDYDWLVLSSANGVDRFFARLEATGTPRAALSGVRVAVVGDATADRLRLHGVEPDLVPDDFQQEGVVAGFAELGEPAGRRVLFARALEGRAVLSQELAGLGYEVDLVAAYQTVPAAADPAVLDELARGVDVVTFTSPSTVKNFLAFLSANDVDAADFMARTEAASIGPVTTAALLARGIEPGIEPAVSTVPALVAAIRDFYA